MPIKDALSIMLDGRNTHFDAKIVDAFLSIPVDVVTDILISEYEDMQIKEKDRKVLNSISMQGFAEIVKKENPSEKEEKIIEVFNSYYVRQKENG